MSARKKVESKPQEASEQASPEAGARAYDARGNVRPADSRFLGNDEGASDE